MKVYNATKNIIHHNIRRNFSRNNEIIQSLNKINDKIDISPTKKIRDSIIYRTYCNNPDLNVDTSKLSPSVIDVKTRIDVETRIKDVVKNKGDYKYKYNYPNLEGLPMLDANIIDKKTLLEDYKIVKDAINIIQNKSYIEIFCHPFKTYKLLSDIHKTISSFNKFSSLKWGENLVTKGIIPIVSNEAINNLKIKQKYDDFISALSSDKLVGYKNEFAGSFKLTKPLDLLNITKPLRGIPLPKIANMDGIFDKDGAITDKAFGEMRLSGPNPVTINVSKEIDSIDLKNKSKMESVIKNINKSDSFEEAFLDKRIFEVKYEELLNPLIGVDTMDQDKYLWAPNSYYIQPKDSKSIIPIGIEYVKGNEKVFVTPNDKKVDWDIAKIVVQIADSNVHELSSHLTNTHLVIESVLVATERNLHYTHPLYVLLKPHFEGTAFINNAAEALLLDKEGAIDKLFANKIKTIQEFISSELFDKYNFDEAMLPNDLNKRGFNEDKLNNMSYPYAEDAQDIWRAIYDWVEQYVVHFYKNDDALEESELQNWVKELKSDDGGKIKGLKEINTTEYLTKVLTHIIFTSTAQHAAVNFPQKDIMSFVPAMPLSGFSSLNNGVLTEQTYKDLLTPVNKSSTQIDILTLLGSVHHNELGDYSTWQHNELEGKTLVELVAKFPELKKALEKFSEKLDTISTKIEDKNKNRIMPYNTLLKKNIPQSINI